MTTFTQFVQTIWRAAFLPSWANSMVLLYIAAAIVSRFWHDKMWVVYLAIAAAAAAASCH